MSKAFLPLLLLIALFGAPSVGATEVSSFEQAHPSAVSPKWGRRTIPIYLSNSLRQLDRPGDGAAVAKAVAAALNTWEGVTGFLFTVSWTDAESASPAQSRGDRKSLITIAPVPENLLMFSGDSSQDAARTRSFTDRRSLISEADIVLNPYQQFTTDGTFGTFDLQSVITHEIGHLLGLSHSPVIGATMFDKIAKNGTFGISADHARTLALDDLSALRALYGFSDDYCCGSVTVQVDAAASGVKFIAWLEEESTGRVVAGRYSDQSGGARLDGVDEGDYILRLDVIQWMSGVKSVEFDADSRIEVRAGKTVGVRVPSRSVQRGFGALIGGTESQFSTAAVVAAPGEEGRMLIGAQGSIPGGPRIFSTSPLLSISEVQFFGGQNQSGLSLFGFDFAVRKETPPGDYTLVLSDGVGTRRFLIGGLSVEKSFDGAP